MRTDHHRRIPVPPIDIARYDAQRCRVVTPVNIRRGALLGPRMAARGVPSFGYIKSECPLASGDASSDTAIQPDPR